MNLNHLEAETLVKSLLPKVRDLQSMDIVVCPPFTSLCRVSEIIRGSNIGLGAQNMHWEKKGAFTGEVSANMLLTLGCCYVILGHSERRQYFHETDEIIARKVLAALGSGLIPIVCVGETIHQREAGETEGVVKTQVYGAFKGLKPDEFEGTVIAYEPVWAIGTGLTATREQAQEAHAFIRSLLAELFGKTMAEETRIQYGGSMKPSNARELLTEPDIDGGLIGGASLEADSFVEIVRAAV